MLFNTIHNPLSNTPCNRCGHCSIPVPQSHPQSPLRALHTRPRRPHASPWSSGEYSTYGQWREVEFSFCVFLLLPLIQKVVNAFARTVLLPFLSYTQSYTRTSSSYLHPHSFFLFYQVLVHPTCGPTQPDDIPGIVR